MGLVKKIVVGKNKPIRSQEDCGSVFLLDKKEVK